MENKISFTSTNLQQENVGNQTLDEQLLEAAFRGDYDTCKTLINDKHVNVNCVGSRYYFEGWTPLFSAATNCKLGNEKYSEIVKLLIDKDADPLKKCSKGVNEGAYPIHAASNKHNNKIIMLFLKAFVPIDILDNYEETPLINAIRGRDTYLSSDHTLNTVTLLVNNGADVNWMHKFKSYTALYVSSTEKKADVMLYLLDKKADPNLGKFSVLLKTVTEWQPSKDKTRVVKSLLDNDSNINVTDNNGRTPLEVAKEMHDEEVVKLIEDKMNQIHCVSKKITYSNL